MSSFHRKNSIGCISLSFYTQTDFGKVLNIIQLICVCSVLCASRMTVCYYYCYCRSHFYWNFIRWKEMQECPVYSHLQFISFVSECLLPIYYVNYVICSHVKNWWSSTPIYIYISLFSQSCRRICYELPPSLSMQLFHYGPWTFSNILIYRNLNMCYFFLLLMESPG